MAQRASPSLRYLAFFHLDNHGSGGSVLPSPRGLQEPWPFFSKAHMTSLLLVGRHRGESVLLDRYLSWGEKRHNVENQIITEYSLIEKLTWAHGCTFLCSSLRIAHLAFVVYMRASWRPRRTAGKCSTAPCSTLPLIFLTVMDVALRQCPPGKTMEASLSMENLGTPEWRTYQRVCVYVCPCSCMPVHPHASLPPCAFASLRCVI